MGTTQVIQKKLKWLFVSQMISLTEKLDFVLWCLPLYVPALALPFIILSSIGVAVMFGHWQSLTVSMLSHDFNLPIIVVDNERFKPLLSPDFQVFSTLCAISPIFSSLFPTSMKKIQAVTVLFLSTLLYYSLMVISWRGIFLALFAKKMLWFPTGEWSTSLRAEQFQLSGAAGGWKSPIGLELFIGALLAIASLASLNIVLCAISSCLLLGAGAQSFGWRNRLIRIAAIGIFAAMFLSMAINIATPYLFPSLAPLLFPVHF